MEEIKHYLNQPKSLYQGTLIEPFKPLISKETYQKAFPKMFFDLKQGRYYQMNYTQPFVSRFQGHPFALYNKINKNNKVPFSAYLKNIEGDILSFSPERFIAMDDTMVKTSPIKGTIKRSSDPLKMAFKDNCS